MALLKTGILASYMICIAYRWMRENRPLPITSPRSSLPEIFPKLIWGAAVLLSFEVENRPTIGQWVLLFLQQARTRTLQPMIKQHSTVVGKRIIPTHSSCVKPLPLFFSGTAQQTRQTKQDKLKKLLARACTKNVCQSLKLKQNIIHQVEPSAVKRARLVWPHFTRTVIEVRDFCNARRSNKWDSNNHQRALQTCFQTVWILVLLIYPSSLILPTPDVWPKSP